MSNPQHAHTNTSTSDLAPLCLNDLSRDMVEYSIQQRHASEAEIRELLFAGLIRHGFCKLLL